MSVGDHDRSAVHPAVRAAAEWCWRLLVILLTIYVAGMVFHRFSTVLVPAALAVLLTAFLLPAVDFLHRHRVPRSVAVALVLILAAAALAGLLTFVGQAFVSGFGQLADQVVVTVDDVRRWLSDGPLGIDQTQVGHFGNNIVEIMQRNQDRLASGALATATTATELVTGAFLMLFLLVFFLYGGSQIWEFCTILVPRAARAKVAAAGVAGFGTLVAYVRATVVVALVDSVCIGIGLAIVGVPLALPLATVIFVFAFIPMVGALISGALAVLIALVTQGWVTAVIVLAILVGVIQLESHVLQPFLMGRSVRLHPVAVVLAIAAGLVGAGVVGGLLAVPLIAFANTAIRHLRGATPAAAALDAEGFERRADVPHWDRPDLDNVIVEADEDVADPTDPTDGPAAETPDAGGPGADDRP
ncbi:MAG: AI-2E family transporter [Gordonia sp. (in: high G+C Gram-positive bacteria)]